MLPSLFVGHGNPMNAISQNAYTESWRGIAQGFPKPKSILCISAHWYVPETAVTVNPTPKTIHDFGGFPQELFEVKYPAPGDPELAARVQCLLGDQVVNSNSYWGLDHGTWSVLMHMYPEADVPVVQLSIDETRPAQYHFDLGTKLAALRSENVLILGSGNLVHNLHTYAWGRHVPEPFEWAKRFELYARKLMLNGEFSSLIAYESLGRDALLSIPTPEHYLPLLYVLGAKRPDDTISFPVEGIDGGSVSMLTVQIS